MTNPHRGREHFGVQDRPHSDAPPFLPGDIVVRIAHPESGAVTVEAVVERGRDEWRIGYRGPHGITGSDEATAFVLAPKGWEDIPDYPAGCVRYGLSEGDRQTAIANDEANAELQEARRRWREAMIAWEAAWLPVIQKARGK